MKHQNALIQSDDDILDLESPADVENTSAIYLEDEESSPRLRLGYYWQAVRKYLWAIVLFTVVVTLLVTVKMAQKPDYYRATARVQVNLESNPALGVTRSNPVVVGAAYDPTYFSSQFQIIEGSGLLRRVVKMMNLEHNQAFLNPRRGEDRSVWQNMLRLAGMGQRGGGEESAAAELNNQLPAAAAITGSDVTSDEEVERLEPYVAMVKNGLIVTPVRETRVAYKETRLIDITFTHYDPVVAAKIANAIGATYVAMNLEKKINTNATASEFLQKRIADLQSSIRDGEELLITYSKNNQIISLDASQNTVVQRLADLNTRLSQAEGERIITEASFRTTLAPGAAATQAAAGDAPTAQLEAKLNDLRHRREQLLVEMMDAAPEVVEVDKQIALIQKDVQEARRQATAAFTANAEIKYREALAREQDLRKKFNQQRDEVLSQNEAAINYRIIQQEIETNKSLLNDLLQRSKENDLVLTGTSNNILLLDRARTQWSPVGPERMRYILLASVASLIGAVGLALLVNFLDNSVRTTEDVEGNLHLPVLTEVPSVTRTASRRWWPSRFSRPGDHNGDSSHMAALDLKGNAATTEAYLQLRTCILLSTAGGPPETLLVTSGQPAEGKTTVAVNLGTVLAQTGAKVLVVDADLRRPSLSRIFDLDADQGLTNLLASKNIDGDTLANNIIFNEASGLHILPAGRVPPNPANLICSPQMERLMTVLRTKFTHIIIDSPPTFIFTDSVLLSTMADGVLLVVRSGKSSYEVVRRTRKMLRDVGAKFVGVVLNDISKPQIDYYRHSYKPPTKFDNDSSLLNLSAN